MMSDLESKEEDLEDSTTFSEGLYDKDLLITEYKQAGEEFRYRDKLLHNSYYLLIIASFAMAGITVREFRSGNFLTTSITVMIGGLGFSLIGAIILNHFIQRRSAEALRTRTEQYAEGIQDEPVKRPLSIQYWVIGNNSKITGKALHESVTFREEMIKLPTKLYTAKLVSFVVFWGGLLLFAVGTLSTVATLLG